MTSPPQYGPFFLVPSLNYLSQPLFKILLFLDSLFPSFHLRPDVYNCSLSRYGKCFWCPSWTKDEREAQEALVRGLSTGMSQVTPGQWTEVAYFICQGFFFYETGHVSKCGSDLTTPPKIKTLLKLPCSLFVTCRI